MIKLIFPGDTLGALRTACCCSDHETFALILARPVRLSPETWRLLVLSVHLPKDNEYELRSSAAVRPSTAFRLPLEKRARREGLSLIYCHSHPSQKGVPSFSQLDRNSEKALRRFASERVPNVPHGALLIGPDAVRGRELGTTRPLEVWQVGRTVHRVSPPLSGSVSGHHDRQVRAFGKDGQRAIHSLRIAVVGCGGTGSFVATELAYLGAQDLLLIDPDKIEKTNLNRVVGATSRDIGVKKVLVTRRQVKKINPTAQVRIIPVDILESAAAASALKNMDIIFCCTDSEGSRFLLNQLAYQYFIPIIDMGVSITPKDGRIISVDGRVKMLSPGLSCLLCVDGTLDSRRVSWDLQNARQRNADPYFRELAGIKQPAVISLNGSVASQAITMFLAAVTNLPIGARSIIFRFLRGDSRILDDKPRDRCVNCSKEGYHGRADTLPLPKRSK